MQYFYVKQDLSSFSPKDIHFLANYYDILSTNRNDLLWLLAIVILSKSSMHAEMLPDKAWDKYGSALLLRFSNDSSTKPYRTTNKLPVEMINADPTPNQIYLEWIVSSYIDGGIQIFEDMGKTKTSLQEYSYLLHKKLVTNKFDKNIGSFCGLVGCKQGKREKIGLDIFLNRYYDALSGIRKVTESKIAEKDAKKIYEDNDVLIISPLTMEASCKYGAETKWCTAGREHNMFERYSKDGPLYILIPKKPQYEREKYQIQVESKQYRNELDKSITFNDLLERFPVLSSIKKFARKEFTLPESIGTLTSLQTL